jgi:NADH-quinone oxidoreductase subunit J
LGVLILFWVMAPVSVAAAAAMLFMRNALHSALQLIVNFFTIAVFFLMLGSPFLFVVQIIVYAGAIMVLFLFVIMLLGVDREENLRERIAGQRWVAVALGAGLVAEVFAAVRLGVGLSGGNVASAAALSRGGNVKALAEVLFSSYFFPFEVTSILLIVAAIGVMLLGRRRAAPRPGGTADDSGGGAAAPRPDLEPVP